MSMNLITLLYLVASVCFIQALKGLSHPTTSRRGNLFGMIGMGIAVLTTVGLIFKLGSELATAGIGYVIVGLLIGGSVGTVMAKRVEMTKMPELVAFMHSMIGLAAVFIAIAAVVEPQSLGIVEQIGYAIPVGNRLELFLGAAIGAITFSGSVIAFGKLSGKYKFRLFQGAPVVFKGQHMVNLAVGLAIVGLGLVYTFTGNLGAFAILVALAFVIGVLIIIPIGGADMPVVVSMLNSYSGWAAAGIGFSLNNSMLIIAGSLVGSSGAILSYIMCKAMNRSFFNVILGGFGAGGCRRPGGRAAGAQREVWFGRRRRLLADQRRHRDHRARLRPGGGPRTARADGTGREADAYGRDREVRDPPGRRPHAGAHERAAGRSRGAVRAGVRDGGHQLRVRPGRRGAGARRQRRGQPGGQERSKSPIAGMPILEAYKAKTVIVNKRSMASGYAGLDNELFYMDKTMMVFGDAKKVVEDMVKAVD